MSTPRALQLDRPNWMRDRRALVIVAVTIIIVALVGIWLSRDSKSPSLQTAGEFPLSEASATAVVKAPHNADGAVSAAASFLSFYGDALQSTSSDQITFFDGIVDENESPTLVKEIKDTIASVQKSVPEGSKLTTQLTPVAYKIETYSNTQEVIVKVWSSLVTSTENSSQVTWTTSEVHLRWEGNHYYVTKWVVRPGPSPENNGGSTGVSANNAASLIAVNGYTAFRTAPAESSSGDQIDVSTQGSK
jgi:hypothetical protein